MVREERVHCRHRCWPIMVTEAKLSQVPAEGNGIRHVHIVPYSRKTSGSESPMTYISEGISVRNAVTISIYGQLNPRRSSAAAPTWEVVLKLQLIGERRNFD